MATRRITATALLATVLSLLTCAPWARADIDADQFQADLRRIAATGSRAVGTPGYDQTVDYVRRQLAALPNVRWQEHSYGLMAPVTEEANLSLADGSRFDVYPFWPAFIRLCTTPAEGIRGRLVYINEARLDQIRPGELAGQIAVVEASAGAQWTYATYFGARAVIVLEKRGDPAVLNRTTNLNLRAFELNLAINIPRFYLPEDDAHNALIRQIRDGKDVGPVTLRSRMKWKPTEGRNFYALVLPRPTQRINDLPDAAGLAIGRATNMGPAGWQQSANPAALMISVPMEAGGLVPDLARGASQAVQTAAGLGLLRQFAANPPDRPVIVCFSGADSMNMMGTRQMLMALADPPSLKEGWREQLQTQVTRQEQLARDLKRAVEVESDPTLLDVTADRSLIDRIVKIIETQIAMDQEELFRIRRLRKEEQTDNTRQREKELEAAQIDLSAVRHGVNRRAKDLAATFLPSRSGETNIGSEQVEMRRQPALEESLLPSARQYVSLAVQRLRRLEADFAERRQRLERRIELYHWMARQLHRNPDPNGRSNNSRLIDTLLSLDFSDGADQIGPMTTGGYHRGDSISIVQNWRDWLSRNRAGWPANLQRIVDIETISGSRSKNSWLVAPVPFAAEMGQAWGVPALSLMTVNDLRVLRDTPVDTLENLNVARIVPQVQAASQIITRAWSDPKLKSDPEWRWVRNLGIEGQVVSPAPGRPVPDLPREGFLATYYYAQPGKGPRLRPQGYVLGTRRMEVLPCDAEGHYRFEGLSRVGAWIGLNTLAIEVFRLADDGSVTACSDLGKQSGDVKIYADIVQDLEPMRSLVFTCEEFALTGLYDPRFLQDLSELTLLDQRRNAEPQRYNYTISRQLMGGFVEPGQSSYLLFRYGRVGNRLVLLNLPNTARSEREARGFRTRQLDAMSALALQTARDFWYIDRGRLDEYRKVGVQAGLIDKLSATAKAQIDRAQRLECIRSLYDMPGLGIGHLVPSLDAQTLMREATGAWANEARVYNATRDMANDVIRAAIFLLLLCVPFAFCMERLLVGTPNIYRQIAYMAIIFVIMMLALRAFHPAFKISNSPLIIIIAFAIIFMSIVVISVVYSKFDTELKRVRSGKGTPVTTSFARVSVLMSAILLGIANMRKRKFRTALTSITIILITFAVLCFTSASSYLDATTLPTGLNKTYTGLQMRQRGFRVMQPLVLDNLQAVLAEPGLLKRTDASSARLVEHWWNVNAADPKDNAHIIAIDTPAAAAATTRPSAEPRRVFAASALIGLSPGQSALSLSGPSPIAQAVPGFERLENGEQKIIYLSTTAAANIELLDVDDAARPFTRKLRIGDRVCLGGIELTVAGLFDPIEFDGKVVSLSGDPLTPLDYQATTLDASGKALTDASLDAMNLDADATAAELSNVYEHLSASQVAIVPAAISRMLPNCTLRGVSLKLADDAEVEVVSKEVAKRFAVALFAGTDDGVQMVAASNLSKVSGAGQVAIPLAIAGLIIFNTMMGSIAERRREIHVYTSLGLAPLHVGALFVAEAMTYGLIGTVFGYVIGQGVGTALLQLGWLGNVTLNYSGTSAMMTMGLILIIVLLSALVPARLASKIAAPSIERTWRVPLPQGDLISAILPFTINKTAADGVLAYLAEYFDAHQEGSIGKFSAGRVEMFFHADDLGRRSRALKATIWLTPFDLGVRQHLTLLVAPGQFEDIYEVQVILQRLSGDDGSWYRMNRTFLTELRKQFLQWRSLSPQRMLTYVQESQRVLTEQSIPQDALPATA